MKIVELLLVLIEVVFRLVHATEDAQFEANVDEIKTDPKSYALRKYGPKRMRKPSDTGETLPGSDSDINGK